MSMCASEMTPADIAAVTGGGNSCGNGAGWGGAWGEWILVFLIFAVFGWGGFGGGFGGFGNGGVNGALTRGELCQDMNFQSLENGVRGVQQGLCDGFYSQNTNILTGFDRLVNNTNQGFNGLNTAVITNGYETRNAINGVGNQLSSCCCDIREAISGVNYNMATNTNAVQHQVERGFCDLNYNMAAQNCNTLQAIDRVGDRVIDYLSNKENQSLRDEVQALRLSASQAAQNNYLVNQLRPCPVPAYITCNPYTASYGINATGYNNGCGCNSCCG